MPRDYSADASRCWMFEIRYEISHNVPLRWLNAVKYCAWSVKPSAGMLNHYDITGYVQFTSARRRSTLKASYHQYAVWRRASHAPVVYKGLYDKDYGVPLDFHHSKTGKPSSFIYRHTKDAVKDILNDKLQTQASRAILQYFKIKK